MSSMNDERLSISFLCVKGGKGLLGIARAGLSKEVCDMCGLTFRKRFELRGGSECRDCFSFCVFYVLPRNIREDECCNSKDGRRYL